MLDASKKMKNEIYILMLIILNSCSNFVKKPNQYFATIDEVKLDSILKTENFNSGMDYGKVSLIYKGKSIFSLGQKLETLDSTFSFRYDPNGKYSNSFNLVIDYLSLDDNLSINLSEGSINGILFFSADQKNKGVFNIGGNWTIAA